MLGNSYTKIVTFTSDLVYGVLSDIAQVFCLHCGQADHPPPHPSTPQPPSLTSVSQHQEPGYDRFSIVCLKVFPNSSSSSTEYFRITLDSCRETLLRPPFTCLMTCKFSFFFFFFTKGHTWGVCILYSLYRFSLSNPLVYLISWPDKRLTWRLLVPSPFLIVIPHYRSKALPGISSASDTFLTG